jgi:hypothetical protein
MRGQMSHKEKMDKESPALFNLLTDLRPDQRTKIQSILRSAAEEVAKSLEIPYEYVRANVFGKDNNRLRIVDGLTHNMTRNEELTISMPIGYGSTGRCFENCRPNIAIFHGDWGKDVIEDKELRKVHPDLRWIISFPIPDKNKNQSIGVLNIDGLNKTFTESELEQAFRSLTWWSQLVLTSIAQSTEEG